MSKVPRKKMPADNDKRPRLSATQIKTWIRCPELWRRRYVLKQRQPPSKAMELGTFWHKALANYYRTGRLSEELELRSLLEAVLPGIPQPRSGLKIERRLACQVDLGQPTEFELEGYLDLFGRRHPSLAQIWDHKTTSSFSWALTQNELAYDVQVIVYAYLALQHMNHADAAEVEWLYYHTKRKPAPPLRVKITLTRDQVLRRFDALKHDHIYLLLAAQRGEAETPKRLEGCRLCPHLLSCERPVDDCVSFVLETAQWMKLRRKKR
jgi:RecB family exonuclease